MQNDTGDANLDAVLDEGHVLCASIRNTMSRLSKSVLLNDIPIHGFRTHAVDRSQSVRDHHQQSTTTIPPCEPVSSPVCEASPLFDIVQRAVAEIDRATASLDSLLDKKLGRLVKDERHQLDVLREALLTREAAAEPPSESDLERSAAVMMHAFRSLRRASERERESAWIHSADLFESSASTAAAMGKYLPSVSPVVVKQMARWRDDKGAIIERVTALQQSQTFPQTSSPTTRPASAHSDHSQPSASAASRPPSAATHDDTRSANPGAPRAPSIAVQPRPSTGGSRTAATALSATVTGVPGPQMPYAFLPFPKSSATWWHRVIHRLQEGRGTTVLRLVGSAIGDDTANAMQTELSTEPRNLLDFVQFVLAQRPKDPTITITCMKPRGSAESNWRSVASESQYQRLARGSPILAARSSAAARFLLQERLSFAADRPGCGILEALQRDADAAPPQGGLWLRSSLTFSVSSMRDKKTMSAHHFVPRQRSPVCYFCTEGGIDDADFGGAWISVDVSPHLVCPHSYAICSSHPFHAGESPRHWVLEGSCDGGSSWVLLRSHVADETLGRGSDFAVFDIAPVVDGSTSPILTATLSSTAMSAASSSAVEQQRSVLLPPRGHVPTRFCGSQFRVRMTGNNSAGGSALQLSSLELYGNILAIGRVAEEGESKEAAALATTDAAVFGCGGGCDLANGRSHWTGVPQFSALPPPPAAKGKGKK